MDKVLKRVYGTREVAGKVFGDYECLNPCPHIVALVKIRFNTTSSSSFGHDAWNDNTVRHGYLLRTLLYKATECGESVLANKILWTSLVLNGLSIPACVTSHLYSTHAAYTEWLHESPYAGVLMNRLPAVIGNICDVSGLARPVARSEVSA